jgi:hypothetical protein
MLVILAIMMMTAVLTLIAKTGNAKVNQMVMNAMKQMNVHLEVLVERMTQFAFQIKNPDRFATQLLYVVQIWLVLMGCVPKLSLKEWEIRAKTILLAQQVSFVTQLREYA